MTSLLLRVIDFETTGFPPDAGIVEIGWCDVKYTAEIRGGEQCIETSVGEWKNQLVNPGKKIEIAAKAVHHISDEELQGQPTPVSVLTQLTEGVDYYVAHNAKFEKEFFQPSNSDGKIPWICTLKAAYRLCPKAPNHQNQTIRYFLNTPCDPSMCIPAHRAGPDAYVTAHTLAKFLTAVPPRILQKWEQEPPLFPYCPIGKERGKPWPDVDQGFLSWMCFKAPTLEADIKWNAMREFNRRKENMNG